MRKRKVVLGLEMRQKIGDLASGHACIVVTQAILTFHHTIKQRNKTEKTKKTDTN
jgi:hypothetical protein